MESFVSLLIGIKDLVADGLTYLSLRLRKDRRFLVAVILGILLVFLLFTGIRSLIKHGREAAQEAAQDLESQMVIPIEMTVSQTPTPLPSSVAEITLGGASLPGMNALTVVVPISTPAAAAATGNTAQVKSSVSQGDVVVVNEYLQKKSGGSQVPIVQQNAQPSPIADYDYEATYYDGGTYEAGEATQSQGE